jgi:hypothetical protein
VGIFVQDLENCLMEAHKWVLAGFLAKEKETLIRELVEESGHLQEQANGSLKLVVVIWLAFGFVMQPLTNL